MKKCNVCFISKNKSEFYTFIRNTGGLSHECKQCGRNRKNNNYLRNRDKILAQHKKRYKENPPPLIEYKFWSEEKKKIHHEKYKRFKLRHPEKYAAHAAVKRKKDTDKSFEKPCIHCGKKAEAHHPDYSKPLDVVWLCFEHHREEHKRLDSLSLNT